MRTDTERPVRLSNGWDRFWFEPQSTATVALVRVVFGLVATAWTVVLAPDLFQFFSRHGIQAAQPTPGWGLLSVFRSNAALVAIYGLLLVGCVCLTVGWHSRLASVIVFLGIVSFTRRTPWLMNSGDALLRVTAFYLMLAPTGAALSVDRWRHVRDRFWEFPARSPWALRLIQIQLSVVYLTAVWSKMQGDTWNAGTAVYYAIGVQDVQRLPVPAFIHHNVLIINLLTYGTLALETSIAVLVWNKKARPYVLAMGVAMHLAMDYALLLTFFSYIVLISYTAFVSPQWLETRVLGLRTRFLRTRRVDSVRKGSSDGSRVDDERAPDCGTASERGATIHGPLGSFGGAAAPLAPPPGREPTTHCSGPQPVASASTRVGAFGGGDGT